jgi:acetyl-CoA carboxylase carboxyltransferase component
MEVIETKVDTSSQEYRENYQNMEALVADLRKELEIAENDRSEKAWGRLAQQNKLPVRKRLELLLDRNTPFLEIAPLAAKGLYDKKVHGAGIVTGIGIVEGREVIIHANDSMIKGGTIYPMGVKKGLRTQTIAMENRLPLIYLVDSGGAY